MRSISQNVGNFVKESIRDLLVNISMELNVRVKIGSVRGMCD